ncbi:RNase H domain-containing protein [Caerostris extrusa]|uniref:RNase H domain-containing protein n=1 Tax=Caerostris extrusa TaxID=172846 RepID=A0AAV4PSF9_CAEEX|nr:RNase H domain-containing protein [Caerostris extrusa]
MIQQTRNLILSITNQKLTITWVKAHVGIVGNERADQLAKEATTAPTTIDTIQIPNSLLRKDLKDVSLKLWQQQWDTSPTGRRTHNYIPKVSTKMSVNSSINYFLTGHGPFPSYLNRFNIKETDKCICGDIGSPDHYLLIAH